MEWQPKCKHSFSCRVRFWEALPPELGLLARLGVVGIARCDRLEALPPEAGQLGRLGVLHISNCGSLQSLLAEPGRLANLGHLEIIRCSRLQSLPRELILLPGLRWISLVGCGSALPDLGGEFDPVRRLQSIRRLQSVLSGSASPPSQESNRTNMINMSTAQGSR